MSARSELGTNIIKRISKEVLGLQQKPLEDIQIIPHYQDMTEIQAWIRGPDDTPYENGYFKIRLLLDQGFPTQPPKGYFMTKIFHPNVSSSGEICVNTLKKDWKSDVGITQILLTIKCLLIVPNAESALNEEAGKLLLEQYEVYAKRASLYTKIHAKSGKSEFQQLYEQSANHPAQQVDTKLDIPTIIKSNSSETIIPANVTTITTTTTPSSVLTPSVVSNSVVDTSTSTDLKRAQPFPPSNHPRPTKQLRTDENEVIPSINTNKTHPIKTSSATATAIASPPLPSSSSPQQQKDKKKRSLRRL